MKTALYQITEDDLATLEAELPRILSASAISCNDVMTRKRWQIVKEIVSNIRWDYGPPQSVEIIPTEPNP